jgi:hypothetical protein
VRVQEKEKEGIRKNRGYRRKKMKVQEKKREGMGVRKKGYRRKKERV